MTLVKRDLGVLFLICGGCTSPKPVVEDSAPRDLRCPREDVVVRERGHGDFVARGCGRIAAYQCHVGEMKCANLNESAKKRAAREFRCLVNDIGVEELSPHVFRVEGCGQSKNYVCRMEDGVSSCLEELQR